MNLPIFLQGDVPNCIPGAHIFNDGMSEWQRQGTQYLNQGAALYDVISSKFDRVLTSIDSETFSGNEDELTYFQPQEWQQQEQSYTGDLQPTRSTTSHGRDNGRDNTGVVSAVLKSDLFAKSNLYANSKVPGQLIPVKL